MRVFTFIFVTILSTTSYALNSESVKDSDRRCLSASGITDVACAKTYPGTMLGRYFANLDFVRIEEKNLGDRIDSPNTTGYITSDLGVYMEWNPKGNAAKRTMTRASEFLLGVDSSNYNIKLYQKNDHGCEYTYNVTVANEGRGPIVCDVDKSVRTSEKCGKYVAKDPLLSKEPRCHQFVHAMLACSKNTTLCRNTIFLAQEKEVGSSSAESSRSKESLRPSAGSKSGGAKQ